MLVPEPNVVDTISILRGLKERYESHHGVRILDSALVIAAQLADRYITNRFAPDKAIDLVGKRFFLRGWMEMSCSLIMSFHHVINSHASIFCVCYMFPNVACGV